MRLTMVLAAVLLSGSVLPALAQDHAHEVSAGAITLVHPWARAAKAGADTLVFMEIVNEGAADKLESASTAAAASVSIVGATLSDGEASYQDVGAVDIPAGDFDLDPNGLGLLLTGLTQDLEQGGDFELTVHFATAGDVTVHVEIEAADATQHSHAGHSH